MMRKQFDQQLTTLNHSLIEMGALVEKAISSASKAFMEQDASLAQNAIDSDREVNEKEREIESLCLKLILHQQPIAKDLRMISAALKMITDMERIGDHAADISEITLYLSKGGPLETLDPIPKMAQASIQMVTESIDAYIGKNLDLANQVIAHDDVVDQLFWQVKKDLIASIQTHPDTGEQALDLLMVAKYFEKIGDHAVNIAEWVVFSITGKHKNKRVV